MPTLLTGGAGYVGAHLALALTAANEPVIALDDLSSGFAWSITPPVKLVVGDIADTDLVERLVRKHKIDALMHLAAKTTVSESVADPLLHYSNNTAKSAALFAAALRAGVKNIVFSSTAAVYGESGSAPVDEEAPLAPVSPYGRSKLMTEQMLSDVGAANSVGFAILRYFNVAGADPAGRIGQSTRDATHLIKVAVEAAAGRRKHVDVFGTDYPTPDGTCMRDYIHVADLTAAHLAALAHLRAGGKNLLCNVGYGRGASVLQVINAVKAVSGADFEVRFGPRRAGDVASVVAATERVRRELGWIPRWDDLNAIVAHALAWERKLMDWGPAESFDRR